ncbi:MAG TPA: hypothetical protein VHV78_12725 [Gemmatimonadaceae bacterium]|nr:hypothetical protein [Gemmatimonadaceae bacterium]
MRRARVAALEEASAELQANVGRYSAAMRKLDEPPERVVTLVKALADDASTEALAQTPSADWSGVRELRADIVRRAIDSYDGEPA